MMMMMEVSDRNRKRRLKDTQPRPVQKNKQGSKLERSFRESEKIPSPIPTGCEIISQFENQVPLRDPDLQDYKITIFRVDQLPDCLSVLPFAAGRWSGRDK